MKMSKTKIEENKLFAQILLNSLSNQTLNEMSNICLLQNEFANIVLNNGKCSHKKNANLSNN